MLKSEARTYDSPTKKGGQEEWALVGKSKGMLFSHNKDYG